MIYLYAFVVCGLICLLGQIVLNYTKLTPGHLNTILVIVGAFLSSIGVYDILIDFAGGGATSPITNYGHLLVSGALKGYELEGFTGFLKYFLFTSSGGVSITIISAFLITLIFKPKH